MTKNIRIRSALILATMTALGGFLFGMKWPSRSNGYDSFEQCVLGEMRGQWSGLAKEARMLCHNRFPPSPTFAGQGTLVSKPPATNKPNIFDQFDRKP